MTRLGRRQYLVTAGAVSVGGLVGGCSSSTDRTPGETLTIGSKGLPESRLLGYLAYEAIGKATDVDPIDEIGFGGSRDNWDALVAGDLDLYWEYTGTHFAVLPPQRTDHPTDPQRLFEAVRADAADAGIRAYPPAPFDNSFVLLADPEWAAQTGVETLSEFARRINAGNTDVRIALGTDFARRPDGWPRIVDTYEVRADSLAALESSILEVPLGLTYQLYRDDRATVVMGYATDPQRSRLGLTLLDDDRDVFPTYNPTPMANADAVPADGPVATVLERLGSQIGGFDTIQRLNGRVAIDGEDPQTVARSFIERIEI
ncbi:ABC transporter substrate-binding protein [Halapricum salinum]|uniref:Glycine/betaine ABC transporter substrate-binding protein n=1 Tax=Halapricum salinum TaxID=1457250 RepID=A0A4D6HEZ8_9EURY|nr:glycine betaine ABC transporter substrate-binding protein [Halapricum salinum]QCC51866.1 glycine/betaine ABC transporter substrate-binding protein [Halapricum salinum]